MGIYSADGGINVTVVDGTSRTGLYAADGSWNVVLADGNAYCGLYHPCGGYWVTVATGNNSLPLHAPDGSLYVTETYLTPSGPQFVTAVSGSLGGNGGGGAYAAKAVHLDGSVLLSSATGFLQGVSDSPLGIMSTWVKGADIFQYVTLGNSNVTLFCDNQTQNCELNTLSTEGGNNSTNWNFYDASNAFFFGSGFAGFSSSSWVHLLASWDMDHPAGEKIFNYYVADTLQSDLPNELVDNNGAFSINYSDGGWQAASGNIVGGADGIIGDMADFYFAPGQYLDLTVAANRRKFISDTGKPVDLGADGSTPTGTAPAVFFSGEAVSFATNKGSGGEFTSTGTLTDASTSPSD